jgi:pimeloyl-ACP methyl ester carboxylesterase
MAAAATAARSRLKKVPKRLVMLSNAGHFPIEEPGVSELRTALLEFLAERSRGA